MLVINRRGLLFKLIVGCGFVAELEEWLTGHVAFANEASNLFLVHNPLI